MITVPFTPPAGARFERVLDRTLRAIVTNISGAPAWARYRWVLTPPGAAPVPLGWLVLNGGVTHTFVERVSIPGTAPTMVDEVRVLPVAPGQAMRTETMVRLGDPATTAAVELAPESVGVFSVTLLPHVDGEYRDVRLPPVPAQDGVRIGSELPRLAWVPGAAGYRRLPNGDLVDRFGNIVGRLGPQQVGSGRPPI
jgi:hypothetical protein